jgi:ribosome-binding factor A
MGVLNNRTARVSEEIKKEVSDIIRNGVRDPRLPEMLSVLKVDVSKDFSHAKIFYSTLAAGGGAAGAVSGAASAGSGAAGARDRAGGAGDRVDGRVASASDKAGGGVSGGGKAAGGDKAGSAPAAGGGAGSAAGGGAAASTAAADAAVAKVLSGAAGFIRRELGARLRLRRTPELHFVADHSIERVIGMNRLISETLRDDAARLESRLSASDFMPKLEKEWS